VDEVVVFGILDESAQQATMLARQTDWHWVRNFGQYDQYVDHDQIQTVIRATRSSENLWINTRKPPLDNVRIRQAVAMGMDRNTGIIVALSGYGSQGLGLMPPGSFWAVEREAGCAVPGWCEPPDMEAQRAEAIQILKEEGFDFDKTYVLTVEGDAQRVNRATFMQEQLRLLGIKTDFDTVETVAYRKARQSGDWGDFMSSTGGVAGVDDPFIGLGHSHRCDSLYNFQTPGTECDATAEALFEELGGLTEPSARKAKGQEVQLHLMSQYWNFPAFWEQEAVAFWPEVRGYSHNPGPTSSRQRWISMWIDPAHKDDTGFSGQTTGVPGGE
jgi:ABC-type transport system substrate-binding protein